MHDIASILLSVGVLGLAIYYIYYLSKSDNEEMMTPEYVEAVAKEEAECRTNLLNSIFTHIGLNLGIEEKEIQQNCTTSHIDEDHSTFEFASEDVICTIKMTWNLSVKIALFRNTHITGKTCFKQKRFAIRDNTLNYEALTRFIVKFRDKAFGMAATDDEKLASGVLAAKTAAEQYDEKRITDLFLQRLADFDLDEYTNKDSLLELYTVVLAYILKFHQTDFLAKLEDADDENTTEEEKNNEA